MSNALKGLKSTEVNHGRALWKKINLILIIVILVAFILLILKIWYDSKHMVSPFLPKYTVLYINGGRINVICFLLGGLIPGLFLRVRRKYLISTICIIMFFALGLILKDSLTIYESFYGLSKYLG